MCCIQKYETYFMYIHKVLYPTRNLLQVYKVLYPDSWLALILLWFSIFVARLIELIYYYCNYSKCQMVMLEVIDTLLSVMLTVIDFYFQTNLSCSLNKDTGLFRKSYLEIEIMVLSERCAQWWDLKEVVVGICCIFIELLFKEKGKLMTHFIQVKLGRNLLYGDNLKRF